MEFRGVKDLPFSFALGCDGTIGFAIYEPWGGRV